MKPYKHRELDYSSPVEVYRCLNRKGRVYSIRQKGLVVGHTEDLYLKDCEFVVNKAGQERCRKTNNRNVHSFIRGYVVPHSEGIMTFWGALHYIDYNPYTDDTFIIPKNNKPVHESSKVQIDRQWGVFIVE